MNGLKKVTLAASMTLVFALSAYNVKAEENFSRISGGNRYETSASICKQGWTQSDYVILAQGEMFPDALCAAPLAKKYNAPILITQKNKLNKGTENEIKRLKAKNIIIIGGEGAINTKVESYIKSKFSGINIERIKGKNRYETSVEVAKRLDSTSKEVVITSGAFYADALSIAPIAANLQMPIILTGKDKLPEEVKSYLASKNIEKTYIVGGVGVISNSIGNELKNPCRLSGKNRYATNIEVLKEFWDKLDKTNVFTAVGNGPTGKEFADALSGAALAAKTGSPMMLTYKDLPTEIESFAESYLPKDAKIKALGGSAILPDGVINKISIKIKNGNKIKIKNKDDKNEDKKEDKDENQAPSTGGAGGSTSGESGNTPEKDKSEFKVNSFYLVDSKDNRVDGVVSEGNVSVDLSSENYGKFTSVVVSTSGKIKSISFGATRINEKGINKVYGDNTENVDLIKYIRALGLDNGNDGLSKSSIMALNGETVEVKDKNNNVVSYKLNIK